MDYRDNPQHRALLHIKWTGFTAPRWWIFTPALTAGRPRVFVGRLSDEFHNLIPGALAKALTLRGLPYGRVFLTGEDAYYCSELIVDAFKHANGGSPFFPEHPMSFRDEHAGEILDYWMRYYEQFGIPVPEGRPGSNPGKISISDKIEIIHRYGFLTNWH